MPITPATSGFIGREDVLRFFQTNILACGQPTCTILSIYGEAGVGKTTLLHYLKGMADRMAASPQFKDLCVTALVDYVPSTPASVSLMKQVADQLAAAKHP